MKNANHPLRRITNHTTSLRKILFAASLLLFPASNSLATDSAATDSAANSAPTPAAPIAETAPTPAAAPVAPKTVPAETAAKVIAFLGVESVPVDTFARQQLKLAEGTGLRVRFIAPESPAAAQLQPGDVLVRLNEQILCNPEQLRTLIRALAPNTAVRLDLRRDGAPLSKTVKLGAIALAPCAATAASARPVATAGKRPILPQIRILANGKSLPLSDILRDKIYSVHGGAITIDVSALKKNQAEVAEFLKQQREGMGFRFKKITNELLSEICRQDAPCETAADTQHCPDSTDTVAAPAETPTVCPHHTETGNAPSISVVVTDSDGSLTLSRKNDCCCICVRDPAGKIIFNGAIETPQQRAALPLEIARKLQIAEQLAPKAYFRANANSSPAAPEKPAAASAPQSQRL